MEKKIEDTTVQEEEKSEEIAQILEDRAEVEVSRFAIFSCFEHARRTGCFDSFALLYYFY